MKKATHSCFVTVLTLYFVVLVLREFEIIAQKQGLTFVHYQQKSVRFFYTSYYENIVKIIEKNC